MTSYGFKKQHFILQRPNPMTSKEQIQQPIFPKRHLSCTPVDVLYAISLLVQYTHTGHACSPVYRSIERNAWMPNPSSKLWKTIWWRHIPVDINNWKVHRSYRIYSWERPVGCSPHLILQKLISPTSMLSTHINAG